MARKSFAREMNDRGGVRAASGHYSGMDPELFDAYHGSNREGLSIILPANDAGVTTNHGLSRADRTYFVDNSPTRHSDRPSERDAWRWAMHAEARSGGRATVYRTMPRGFVAEDRNFNSGEGAFTTSSQQVRSEISTPPPELFLTIDDHGDLITATGVQGTLPGQNWNHYKTQRNPEDLGDEDYDAVDHTANFAPVYPTVSAQPAANTRLQRRSEVPGQKKFFR